MNSAFHAFIGIGAVLILFIFESNLERQLELYYDNGEKFCAECYNLTMRQAFKAIAIWIMLLGFAAGLLITRPDDETAEAVMDYDLLAFTHLDLPQQAHVNQEQDPIDKQVLNLTQMLETRQFKTIVLFAISGSRNSMLTFSIPLHDLWTILICRG